MPLPDGVKNLKAEYGRRAVIRAPYLQQAHRNEHLTMETGCGTEWDQITQTFRYTPREHLFTSIGAVVERGFASVITGTILPAQTTWLRYKLSDSGMSAQARSELERRISGGDRGAIEAELRKGEQMAMEQAQHSKIKSAFFHALCSTINSGLTLMFVKKRETVVYPMSQFCADREDGSYVRFWIMDARNKQVGESVQPKTETIYTLIDRQSGEVWQQIDENPPSLLEDVHPDQFVEVSLESPYGKHAYPTPMAYFHMPLFRNANAWTRAMNAIVVEAATLLKGVREGSGLEPHDVAAMKSGSVFKYRTKDDLTLFSIGWKINDAQLLWQAIEKTEAALKSYFNYGLLDREIRPETATLVRQLVSEMNAIGSQYYAHLADHAQADLARALLHITGYDVEISGGIRIIPMVLTGLAAFSRQESAERILAIAERCTQINPEFGTKVLDMPAFFMEIASNYQVEVEHVVRQLAEVESLIQSLAQKIDEDPANAEVVANFLEQLISNVRQPQDRLPESASEAAQLSQGTG